jgi:hypothetical protein
MGASLNNPVNMMTVKFSCPCPVQRCNCPSKSDMDVVRINVDWSWDHPHENRIAHSREALACATRGDWDGCLRFIGYTQK